MDRRSARHAVRGPAPPSVARPRGRALGGRPAPHLAGPPTHKEMPQMTATTITSSPVLSVPIERISAPENVRELDPAHVDALAGSISLQGLLVPVLVRETADGYELVAGFHRLA